MIVSIMICLLTEPVQSESEIREKLKVELIREIKDRLIESRNTEKENLRSYTPVKPAPASNV